TPGVGERPRYVAPPPRDSVAVHVQVRRGGALRRARPPGRPASQARPFAGYRGPKGGPRLDCRGCRPVLRTGNEGGTGPGRGPRRDGVLASRFGPVRFVLRTRTHPRRRVRSVQLGAPG